MREGLSDKRRRAGRQGGRATVARHGRQYMAAIGRRGAAALWQRYQLTPAGLAGWALVDRETGKIRAAWGVQP